MRILLLNQFFWPDASATSQFLTDLARGLADSGHEVHAIAADGGYTITSGDDQPNVHIHRVKSAPFVRGKLGRMLSYASFYLGAAWRGMRLPHPDVVVTLTTPPLLSLLGNGLTFLRGSRHFIWEMDMYPDVAVALNYFTAGGVPDRLTGALADFSRRHADGVIALGDCMKQRLISRGIPKNKIHVADNWADSQAISVLPRPGDSSQLVVLYSGNLGLAHDLTTIVGAMKNLKGDRHFHFIFAGSGARREELSAIVKAECLDQVELRPYVPRQSLSESLAAGDIGLVTQRDDCCGAVVPSKVYGLLAAGRPILFIGPAAATPALIIQRFACGWHVPCGDIATLTQLLQRLSVTPEEVAAAGRSARRALLEHFDRPLGVARVAEIIGADSMAHPSNSRIAGTRTTLQQHSDAHS